MYYESRKILVRRLVWLALLLTGVIMPIIASVQTKEAVLIADNGYINDYYESLDETNCEIEVIFNCAVDSGNIIVMFYDVDGKLLTQETGDFYHHFDDEDNTLTATFFIDGKVDAYAIGAYEISAVNNFPFGIFILMDLFLLGIVIDTLFLSCKIYHYGDYEIIAYAGWYHHYLKVNGQKVDEHNTITSLTPIFLSCTLPDGTTLDATISRMKRIALKINDLLYTEK